MPANACRRAKPAAFRMDSRSDGRTKIWDTTSFRTLPVTNFAMILPIEVPEPREKQARRPPNPILSSRWRPNAQVAELVDDLLVFQSETRNMLYAMVAVVAVAVVHWRSSSGWCELVR